MQIKILVRAHRYRLCRVQIANRIHGADDMLFLDSSLVASRRVQQRSTHKRNCHTTMSLLNEGFPATNWPS